MSLPGIRFPIKGPSRPTAGDLWPQVKDQGAADQTEAEARRYERDQHGGREDREDDERAAPCHAPRTLGHFRSHSPRGFRHLTDGPRTANVTTQEETLMRLKIMNLYVKPPSL